MQILFDGWDELSRDMIWILPLFFFFLTFSYFLRLRHTNPRNLKWKLQSVQFDSESIEILTKKQNLRHCVWCIHTIEKVSVDVFFVCSKIHEQSTRTTSLLNDKITILNHRIPIENNTVNDRRLMRKKIVPSARFQCILLLEFRINQQSLIFSCNWNVLCCAVYTLSVVKFIENIQSFFIFGRLPIA